MIGLKITREKLKIKKILVVCILASITVIPLISTSAMLNNSINKSMDINGIQILQGTTNLNNDSKGVVENFISYLNENEWGAKYLSVAAIAQTANKIILSTSKAFMALGGVSGTDRVLTLAKFRETLKKKEIKLKNEYEIYFVSQV